MNAIDYDQNNLHKHTVALVEADGFAIHALWLMNASDAEKYCNMGNKHRVKWEQISFGDFITAGYLDGMPVTVSLLYAKINNHIVTFWNSPSMVSDHRLIEKWFKENLPEGVHATDASNFHTAVHHISLANAA